MKYSKKKKEYYLVDFEILPTAIKNTIRAKQMLENGSASTIYEAVKKMGISRSAFYKYKDHISDVVAGNERDLLTVIAVIPNDTVVVTRLLRKLDKLDAVPVTMEKSAPAGKYISMTFSFFVMDLPFSTDELVSEIKNVKGISNVIVVGEV